jgi:D-glycero-D-manno-heptose 1,7-bisphosphate phosphatase
LGYLPEVIQKYFGDGTRWGIQIQYSVSEPDDLTVRRVQLAHNRLDPCFLLLYCDNYWPMQIERMWTRFVAADVLGMTTVYSNKDKYSRDSVIIDPDGYVQVIDRSRTTPGLQGIEISYAFLKRSALEFLPAQDALIEEALYPELARRRQLLAYVTHHRYYSIGSPERLPLTEAFLARQPAVILDRDGVLNRRPLRAQYVRNVEEFTWLPGAKDALRLFKEAGYRVIVVSNQAGIARGAMTEADLTQIHDRMKSEAIEAGGQIDAIYYCPHDWGDGCDCRKPKAGMLFQAQRDFSLDLSRTFFIGDDDRDAQAADAAGAPAALLSDRLNLLDVARSLLGRAQAKQCFSRAVLGIES